MADEIDISRTIDSIVKNPIDWVGIFVTGLHMLIPIMGPIALLGWQRRIYDEALKGNITEVPKIHLIDDFKYGLSPLVALLNSALVIFAFIFCIACIAGCGGVIVLLLSQVSPELAALFGGLGLFFLYFFYIIGIILLSLGLNIINVELQRRGNQGDMFPISQFREIGWLMRNHTKAYFLAFVGVFISGLFGSIGVFACYLGMFVSLPLGMIGSARILAQWNQSVERKLIRG